ncbi:MAG: response regulator [Anaerolineae bacterium]
MEIDNSPDLTGDQVRAALEALYDSASLGSSAMAGYYPEVAALPGAVERAQALRSLLLDAIEALRPLQSAAGYAQAARDYEVLSLRYASGLSVEQVAEQLCVGARQVYRDLRRAEEKLTEILRNRHLAAHLAGLVEGRDAAMRQEVASLQHSQQTLDAREIVAAAVRAVQPLATCRYITIVYEPPVVPVLARGTPGILRTVLIQLLSSVIQSAGGHAVSVSLACSGGEPTVSISCSSPEEPSVGLAEAISSARLVNLNCHLQQSAGGSWQVLLHLPQPRPKRILVIEDNPSASELYERYLEGSGWQVARIENADAALEAARSQRPSAIILDIMMPQLDGWTVLQNLRMDPETANIPVIVSSVVHDPGLAEALGASACLAKPVSRLRLLTALRKVLDPGN